MKLNFKKTSATRRIAKYLAVAIFFMGLYFNVKVSLDDPFVRMDNAALAQTSSKSGCFIRTKSSCPSGPGGTGGGERVTCDTSGVYVAGESCTRVVCVAGATNPIYCQENPY